MYTKALLAYWEDKWKVGMSVCLSIGPCFCLYVSQYVHMAIRSSVALWISLYVCVAIISLAYIHICLTIGWYLATRCGRLSFLQAGHFHIRCMFRHIKWHIWSVNLLDGTCRKLLPSQGVSSLPLKFLEIWITSVIGNYYGGCFSL